MSDEEYDYGYQSDDSIELREEREQSIKKLNKIRDLYIQSDQRPYIIDNEYVDHNELLQLLNEDLNIKYHSMNNILLTHLREVGFDDNFKRLVGCINESEIELPLTIDSATVEYIRQVEVKVTLTMNPAPTTLIEMKNYVINSDRPIPIDYDNNQALLAYVKWLELPYQIVGNSMDCVSLLSELPYLSQDLIDQSIMLLIHNDNEEGLKMIIDSGHKVKNRYTYERIPSTQGLFLVVRYSDYLGLDQMKYYIRLINKDDALGFCLTEEFNHLLDRITPEIIKKKINNVEFIKRIWSWSYAIMTLLEVLDIMIEACDEYEEYDNDSRRKKEKSIELAVILLSDKSRVIESISDRHIQSMLELMEEEPSVIAVIIELHKRELIKLIDHVEVHPNLRVLMNSTPVKSARFVKLDPLG